MRTKSLIAGIAAGLALLTAACGSGDDTAAPADSGDDVRQVEVDMVDIDFEPKTLDVAKGEAVRFTFNNEGKVRHEAYFGDAGDQAEHAKEMAEGDGGHEGHGGGDEGDGDGDKVTVDPGERADITYRFEEAGTFEIGCHEPGHYAAGMKITVNVT